MKFLHLSDLHIGKTVYGFSMLDDQDYILEQIINIIAEIKPQAVVISGDVYDKQTPGSDAVRLFDDFLTNLAKFSIKTMIISGNHDSPERLDFASRIMSGSGIYIYGRFSGELRQITMTDEYGDVCFYLMPFIKPSFVRRFYDCDIETYYDAVKTVIESVKINTHNRNVIVAHQFFVNSGVAPEICDSEIGGIGGLDSVDCDLLKCFDYAALGHLHGPQRLYRDTIRYAGSPLKYSASECYNKKSITVVDLKQKGDVSISVIPLKPKRDMRRVKGSLSEIISANNASLNQPDDYVHITLTDEGEVLDAMAKIRQKFPNVMTLCFEKRIAASDLEAIRLENYAPSEMFESFFKEQNGAALNAKQTEIIRSFFEKGGLL